MKIDVFYSDTYQNAKNCLYPNHGTAENAEEFAQLVKNDHVFFDFKGGYRSNKNFLGTNVASLDCDNDHSDYEDDWITLKKLVDIFHDVRFVAYTSRNYKKQKGGKSPRPRYHIVFPIRRITSAAIEKRVENYYSLIKVCQVPDNSLIKCAKSSKVRS